MDHVAHVLAMSNYKFIINTSLVKRCAGNVNILWKCQNRKIVEVMKITLNFFERVVRPQTPCQFGLQFYQYNISTRDNILYCPKTRSFTVVLTAQLKLFPLRS